VNHLSRSLRLEGFWLGKLKISYYLLSLLGAVMKHKIVVNKKDLKYYST
jgi:hypothetical protein